MSSMGPNRYEDLIAAYALGALPEDERREIEEYLSQHPERQTEVDELRFAAGLLALAPEEQEPPPGLRRSIMSAIGPETETPELREETSSGWLRGWFGFPRLAFAASALVVVAGLLVWNLTLQDEVRDLQGQIAEKPAATQTYAVNGSGVAQSASGQVVKMEDGRTVLRIEGLPQAPRNKTYQIWLIEGDKPTPDNVFEPGGGMAAASLDHPLNKADVVAVTVEPDGGSKAPTSKPILTSKL